MHDGPLGVHTLVCVFSFLMCHEGQCSGPVVAPLKLGQNGTLFWRVAGLGDHFAHLESDTEACVVAAALIRRDELPSHYVRLKNRCQHTKVS